MVDRFEVLKNKIEELAKHQKQQGYGDTTESIINNLIDAINNELEGEN